MTNLLVTIGLILFAFSFFIFITRENKVNALRMITNHAIAKMAVAESDFEFLEIRKEWSKKTEVMWLSHPEIWATYSHELLQKEKLFKNCAGRTHN